MKSKTKKIKKTLQKLEHFKAEFILSPKKTATIEFDLEYEDLLSMVIDLIEDAAYDSFENDYPSEYYPKASLKQLYVFDSNDSEFYPIVGYSTDDPNDDEAVKEMDKSKKFKKFLVLPYARYELSPECKLWMHLKEEGILDEDAEFDYEKMHRLVAE